MNKISEIKKWVNTYIEQLGMDDLLEFNVRIHREYVRVLITNKNRTNPSTIRKSHIFYKDNTAVTYSRIYIENTINTMILALQHVPTITNSETDRRYGI